MSIFLEELQRKDQEQKWLTGIRGNPSLVKMALFPTSEMFRIAFQSDPSIIEFAPSDIFSEQDYLRALSWDAFLIRFIKNPSVVLKMAAIRKQASAIKFIEKPTDEMCEIAAQSGVSLKLLSTQSTRTIIAAIKSNKQNAEYIKNPTPKLWLEILHHVPVDEVYDYISICDKRFHGENFDNDVKDIVSQLETMSKKEDLKTKLNNL